MAAYERQGGFDGYAVGSFVGRRVFFVGNAEGALVGAVGASVGPVGAAVGSFVGAVGAWVGLRVGHGSGLHCRWLPSRHWAQLPSPPCAVSRSSRRA